MNKADVLLDKAKYMIEVTFKKDISQIIAVSFFLIIMGSFFGVCTAICAMIKIKALLYIFPIFLVLFAVCLTCFFILLKNILYYLGYCMMRLGRKYDCLDCLEDTCENCKIAKKLDNPS